MQGIECILNMTKTKDRNYFWVSYSDLVTSLFFITLVLFVICLAIIGSQGYVIAENQELKNENYNLKKKQSELESQLKKLAGDLNKAIATLDKTQKELKEANATVEQLNQITQLDNQFKVLANSSSLGYNDDKKMFYAKDFVGVEIFQPNKDQIKTEYLGKVDRVGLDLLKILKILSVNNFKYQLVIEGTAAIPYSQLKQKTFNADNKEMYMLSYRRALSLYNRWRMKGYDFRKYNTEIIIAGSGFNGINRDEYKEENNKRFIIQIIPKVGKPK